MADGKVNLHFSSSAEMLGINQISDGVKATARDFKDFGDAGSKVVSALSAKFDNELTVAIGGAYSILGDMVRGGLWGLLASVASKAIDFAITKWTEFEEKIKAVGEVMRAEGVAAMAAVGAKVSDLSLSMQNATKDADSLLQALNGKVASDAKYEVARLHVETLQKITDGVSEAGRAAILAEEAYEAGMIKAGAAVEQANNVWQDAMKRKEESSARIQEAEANLAAAEAAQARFAEDNNVKLAERAKLETAVNTTYETLIAAGYTEQEARKQRAAWQVKLNEFDKANSALLEQQAKINKGVNEAKAAHARTVDAATAADERYHQAAEAVTVAELSLRAANLELAERRQRAASALAAEQAAQENLEIAELETARQLEWQNKIYEIAKKAKIESGSLINRLNELMEEGCEDEEIRHELNEAFAEIMERRNKAESDNADDAEKESKRRKNGKKNNGNGATVAMTAHVSNTKEQAQDVEQAANFKDWKRQQREAERKARDDRNKLRVDQSAMVRFLKGNEPSFAQYMKTKYTPEQAKQLGKEAVKAQLLSKSEAKKQYQKIIEAADLLAKSMTVR